MDRPVLTIPRQTLDWILEGAAGIAFVTLLGLVAYYYSALPDIVPVHFNASGTPDKMGSKESIFLLPSIGLVIFIALLVSARLPHRFNYLVTITEENAAYQYRLALRMIRCINCIIQILFVVISFGTISTALGETGGLNGSFVFAMIAVLLITIALFVFQSIRHR